MAQDIGKLGQLLACLYLTRHGYVILEQNRHIRKDEIDIIAQKDSIYHIIEVKTRSSQTFEKADFHFSQRKIGFLKRAATEYAYQAKISDDLIMIQGIAIQLNFYSKMANIKHYISLI